jgi:hypothetical protein
MFMIEDYFILEEQRRSELYFPPVNKLITNELKRLYPRYELAFNKEFNVWVLYWVKASGGGPSDDLMSKQFVLPQEPGMWLINYMTRMDKANESLKDFKFKRKVNHERWRKRKDQQWEEDFTQRQAEADYYYLGQRRGIIVPG